METEKLYYHDMYQTTFDAAVLSCEEGKNGWQVVLDQTLFYPEGGGQPADHGVLGGVNVIDVHEKDGVITHTCDAPLALGAVSGTVDWARRWDHTQQHSGEHIFSGIACELFGCDNVGFHMGADVVTVDYNAEISWEQALEIERRCNERIQANAFTQIEFPSAEELKEIPYRSKKELSGQVRIVTFPRADCCACCGTHVKQAGEVMLVKVLSAQKCRGGTRMEIVCGQRALNFLTMVFEQNRAVGQALSVKHDGTAAAVGRLQSELSEMKMKAAQLEAECCSYLAEQYADQGDVLVIRAPMAPGSVRILTDAIAKRCGGLAAVFAGEGSAYNYALGRADGQDISPLVKAMNGALNGRGGGRGGFAQGSVQSAQDAIENFWKNR